MNLLSIDREDFTSYGMAVNTTGRALSDIKVGDYWGGIAIMRENDLIGLDGFGRPTPSLFLINRVISIIAHKGYATSKYYHSVEKGAPSILQFYINFSHKRGINPFFAIVQLCVHCFPWDGGANWRWECNNFALYGKFSYSPKPEGGVYSHLEKLQGMRVHSDSNTILKTWTQWPDYPALAEITFSFICNGGKPPDLKQISDKISPKKGEEIKKDEKDIKSGPDLVALLTSCLSGHKTPE